MKNQIEIDQREWQLIKQGLRLLQSAAAMLACHSVAARASELRLKLNSAGFGKDTCGEEIDVKTN